MLRDRERKMAFTVCQMSEAINKVKMPLVKMGFQLNRLSS